MSARRAIHEWLDQWTDIAGSEVEEVAFDDLLAMRLADRLAIARALVPEMDIVRKEPTP